MWDQSFVCGGVCKGCYVGCLYAVEVWSCGSGYVCSVGHWERGLYWILGDAGALRRWSTVTELCKGTPGVVSARPVFTSCDIDVVLRIYHTLSGVMIVVI